MKKVRHNKVNQNLMDQDYWHKLSESEKEYLNQFNKEYYEAIYKEEDRVIHSAKYDQDLKDARSARRKDAFNNSIIGTGDNGASTSVDNDMDIYTEDKNPWSEQDSLSQLKKIDEKIAMDILKTQAIDLIINEIDDLEDTISDLQRDTIKLFINARKNQ